VLCDKGRHCGNGSPLAAASSNGHVVPVSCSVLPRQLVVLMQTGWCGCVYSISSVELEVLARF
jgi:hypothetical protein